jgi:hypothetical protein
MFVEIGRRDTYPLTRDRETDAAAPLDLEEGEFDAIRRYSRGHPGLGRELQVYEAWIKVQVKPKGLRCVVRVCSAAFPSGSAPWTSCRGLGALESLPAPQ